MDYLFVRFVQAQGMLSRTVGGGVILAPTEGDGFDSLSATAGAAWRLLEVPRTVPDLIGRLAAAYEIPASSIALDVEMLVEDMLLRGWIEELKEDHG